jgi:hypothetical protein
VAGTVPGSNTCRPDTMDGTVCQRDADAEPGASCVPAGMENDVLTGAQLDTGTRAAGIDTGLEAGSLIEAVAGNSSVPLGTALDAEAG